MTTGEKIAVLRKNKNLTQEQLAEILNVSRQSVSRWEMDAAFPETEKLVKLGRVLECSIDYLLNEKLQNDGEHNFSISVGECYKFIRECGYFFLATSRDNVPKLRPMGMIYSNERALFLVTDKRKNVYAELAENPRTELAAYSLNSRRWIRIAGWVQVEGSETVKEEIADVYPMVKQEYAGEEEVYLVIFKLRIENIQIY